MTQITGIEGPLWAGIDIGGTKIGVCVGDDAGRLFGRERFATDPAADPPAVIEEALRRIAALAGERAPVAYGVACPGPMSSREGRFLDPPNMPRWHGFQLVKLMRARVSAPVAMMNDANAAMLAEWRWGAAKGADTAVFVTMSTGMGAGLIIGGRLHEGIDDLAGEIGHIRLDPDGPVGFAKRGSVEGYLCGAGVVQLAEAEARVALHTGEATALVGDLSAAIVCAAAADGDPAASRAIDRSADALGRLAALLVDLLNPEVIVLGTIGTAWPDLFIPRCREVLAREAIGRAAARVRIVPSALGEARGDLQALAVALRAADGAADGTER